MPGKFSGASAQGLKYSLKFLRLMPIEESGYELREGSSRHRGWLAQHPDWRQPFHSGGVVEYWIDSEPPLQYPHRRGNGHWQGSSSPGDSYIGTPVAGSL